MTLGSIRSLQLRLVARVATLYIVATIVVIGVLMVRAFDTARSLGDRELLARAAELARFVSVDSTGTRRLALSATLSSVYQAQSADEIFAIRDLDGGLIEASPTPFGAMVTEWSNSPDGPEHFSIREFGDKRQDYYGLTTRQESVAGPLSISVARSAAADMLMYSLLRRFIHDTVWAVSLLVLTTVVVAMLGIRSGLKPIREVSLLAAAIGPSAMSLRLPDRKLPSEITPLVAAVNLALDRLEQGFAVQREFTANAAHELRTPLAIITAALDVMESNDELAMLKGDVTRMNRLVEQLLRVARLDAIALDVSGTVDLNDIAAGTAATMVPWAVAQDRIVSFGRANKPVVVRGNSHAIADAIRNLIENAVTHSPPFTEVTVSADADGSVHVADQGSGIPPEDRQRIFARFWRGKDSAGQGAGLGLAIVTEIMKAHGGSITVDDPPNGGALITLHFRLAEESNATLA
jgi:signal transduction histidine kinase